MVKGPRINCPRMTFNYERGLALIAKAAEHGYFIPRREAYLQALYDNTGFAPIGARQEARQARERERLLAIVCTDNPYVAVWQPAAETCERFATADIRGLRAVVESIRKSIL